MTWCWRFGLLFIEEKKRKVCVFLRLNDLFLGAKKTHPDPERCFDYYYYYSIYTHTYL